MLHGSHLLFLISYKAYRLQICNNLLNRAGIENLTPYHTQFSWCIGTFPYNEEQVLCYFVLVIDWKNPMY